MDLALDPATIELFSPSLFRYAARRTGRDDLAQDLVQETWLAALGSMSSFAGRSTLKTWLTSILRRKIVDHHRRRRVEVEVDEHHLVSEPVLPTDARDDAAAVAAVRELLEELPRREREALELCDIDGLERDEAAEKMGVTRGALRVLLHRGRHRVREGLVARGFVR